jgi:hypothetical protein
MYRLLLAALVASAALAPAAFAADDHMMAMPATVMMCHNSKSGEKPNAMMGSTGLMCKAVQTKKLIAGPDMTNVKTAAEADQAWKDFVRRTITSPL